MTGSSLARWRGSPNHYSGRQGWTVDHITLHIMVGWLWGTDSCFQRSSFQAASHYGVGGDGTVLQWVDEDDGSWADGNRISDCSGVTIEHEGGMEGIPMTDACVEASARLCADIARRHGLGRLWHDDTGQCRGNVYLHREVVGSTHAGCPDLAVNGLPYQRVIDRANELLGYNQNNEEDDMPSAKEVAQAVWAFEASDGANKQPMGNPYEQIKMNGGPCAVIVDNDGTVRWINPILGTITGFATWDEWTVWCNVNHIPTNTDHIRHISRKEYELLKTFLKRMRENKDEA